jgi:uncharacterized membrane protein YfcA
VTRRPWKWWQAGCAALLGCSTITIAGTYIAVHMVTAWITGHPGVVWAVVGMAAAGGAIGGWIGARYDARQERRDASSRDR